MSLMDDQNEPLHAHLHRRQIHQRPWNGCAVPIATAAVPIMAWCSLPIDKARTNKSTSAGSTVLPLEEV